MIKYITEAQMNKKLFLIVFILAVFAAGCSRITGGSMQLLDAKIAFDVDENFMPVMATDEFPTGTAKVSCWFSWRNTKIGTKLVAKWHYLTDDIHILDYEFEIPRKEGSGSVYLAMPEEKVLPSGEYQVKLISGWRTLKTLTFRVN